MTDFYKVKAYYSIFDEQHRLESTEGRLEFEIAINLLLKHLHKNDRILDLGGGAGKYAITLSNMGYKVTLANLSQRLLDQAKEEIECNNYASLAGIDLVNAIDLSCYKNNSFESVILFGPLYHLLESEERKQCISEVNRVLKPGGTVFASFIPYLSGAVGIVNRIFNNPNQVDQNNLSQVFSNGKFNNNVTRGFQEGYYPKSCEIEALFEEYGFQKILTRSIRGFGYNREEEIYNLLNANKDLFETIIKLIHQTAEDPAIIETCGHAIYIGSNASKQIQA